MINSEGDSTVVNGFSVPSNSTILDGWLHVSNSPLPSSTDFGIVWDEDDFASGNLLGMEINDDGAMVLKDDGTRSNVSTFDVGEIEVILNSDYTYSPGWKRLFVKSTSTNISACGGSYGIYLEHGMDGDFDQILDTDEIEETLYFCESFGNEDVVTSLNITNRGTGYVGGNLTASGGGGSGFAGTYSISSGIQSITVNSGGSGYGTDSEITIQCQCDGEGANASIGSVDSNGSILTVNIVQSGSGYQSNDIIAVFPANGTGASLTANLFSTGKIHSAEITDGGENFSTAPTILISDTGGNGGAISASLGGYYDYEVDVTTELQGENCQHGGYKIESGLDLDEDRDLDISEINETMFICNNHKLWQATTFMDLNGTSYADEQTLPHGVVPSSSSQGIVSAGTLPGNPVPAGTFGHLIIPEMNVPSADYLSSFFLTFDHWYHVDSTSSGQGDGTWVEYRLRSEGEWSNWTYMEPQGGYPSTMSTEAPIPIGASSPVPVFASSSHSGWVSSNFTLSSLDGIADSEKVQFRFLIWTHPNASNERPGWFIDNIDVSNYGVNLDVWHHGCLTTTSSSCTYSPNAYGVLQRTIDLSGTNSTSKIEMNLEWDLEGAANDNACVEISLNGNTWADISSSTSSTSSDCSSRSGPIPGNGYTADNNQTYYDTTLQDFRRVSFEIPTGFQNKPNVYLRVVVDTSASTNYGGSSPGDSMEGIAIDYIRVADYNGSTLFIDNFDSSNTITHYGMNDSMGIPMADDWAYRTILMGSQTNSIGFEDSTASSPAVSDAPGWSRSTAGTCSSDRCRFTLNKVSTNSGPPDVSSFPYAYGIGFSGNYEGGINEARLISPIYEIPLNGTSYLTFDHWSCSEPSWDGGAVFISVNGASWQHFDPGWYSSTAYSNAGHNLANKAIFSMDHCTGSSWTGATSTSGMTNLEANLDSYKGDSVRFKFAFGSDSFIVYSGWFIDNAGVKISNYGVPGDWISPLISLDLGERFNHGFIDIEGKMHEEGWLTGSILEATSGDEIPGFSNISFPFSLAGIDSAQYPKVRLKIHAGSDDPEQTPIIERIHIGGKRILNADSGSNGWELSPGVEVVNGLLNATAVTGTITSDFVYSSRPIKSIKILGNISSSVSITAYDVWGNSLGTASKGGTIQFPNQEIGYSLSVSLPTNGWIDVLRVVATFSNPALDPRIDVLNDGSDDWSFPASDSSDSGFGHLGWQSMITSTDTSSRSTSLSLDGTNPETITFLIPESASINSGIVSISPDMDGFIAPVSISVAGSSVSGGSGNSPFLTSLSMAQISGIGLLNPSLTDSQTGRNWVEVPLSISSTSAQNVSVSTIGIGYQFFENVSGLGGSIADYISSLSSEESDEEADIPIAVTSDYGAVSIDGSILFDYLFVNRDFSVPSTLYPDGEDVEIVTSHHHLFDNSEIAEITLIGSASDGNSIEFRVQNSADGLWGAASQAVSFSQTSGNSLAPLSYSDSFVTGATHSDGYADIEVHWVFNVNWGWDDTDYILWEARANDALGETIWPANSQSGFGVNAVENDLQIDFFEVRDNHGRLISNTQDTLFYPFPILDGGDLHVSGTVRFQDSEGERPSSNDYSVGLNLSGTIHQLQSGEGGTFQGVVSSPLGIEHLSLTPVMLSVGPPSAIGAEDATGITTQVEIIVDGSPPIAGPIEVQTPVGLQSVDGMVIPPTVPFSPYVTISESEARGDSLTLRYWRTGIDDSNDDGIADENEYQYQTRDLSQGLTGEQQIQFQGIDVSQLDNEMIHLYLEGTDWAGLSYQDGGSGGSSGAENAWASVVVAEDIMVEFAGAGLGTGSGGGSTFSLDRKTQDSIDYFLIPGKNHTFKVRLDEPNGFRTIDNITIYLCGYSSQYGVIHYDPFTETLSTPDNSMLDPLGSSTQKITDSVTELSVRFRMSWDMPFTEDDFACKPRVLVQDGLEQIESQVLSSLSWRLDNRIIAVPIFAEDLTEPIVPALGIELFLGKGDAFSISGSIYHEGSGERLIEAEEGIAVRISMVYGSGIYESTAAVSQNGNFSVEMSLPDFQPLVPTTALTLSLFNTPGESHSVENSEASATVDTKSPTALFNVEEYPDSSLTVIETDTMDEVMVTVTILEEIGMNYGPLQVSWVFQRNGEYVVGTESSGELPWLSSNDGKHVYQGMLDFTPELEFNLQEGDRVAFWVSSTDKAGNTVSGLGGPDTPRSPTLRIVEFEGQYTREVVEPTRNPLVGETLKIVSYWENPGKDGGTLTVGLYEQKLDGTWQPSISTLLNGPIEVYLPPGSSSVKAEFEYQTWKEGQPYLVLVVDGDFENSNYKNVEISGIDVSPVGEDDNSGQITIWVIGSSIIVISMMGGAFYVLRKGAGQEYYDDDYEDEEDEHPGWLWDSDSNEWVPDPDYQG